MGLDITVYKHVELELAITKPGDDEWDWADDNDLVWLYQDPAFQERSDGLPTGFYRGEVADGFWAGSYTGYGELRRSISMGALRVPPEQVWNGRVTGPLVELINFSDCEGFLGPRTCAKLAADCVTPTSTHRTVSHAVIEWIEGRYPDPEIWLDTWASFVSAFTVAAEHNGVVRFH